MKYIKTFEKSSDKTLAIIMDGNGEMTKPYKFKIGDYVKYDEQLKIISKYKNRFYKITDIYTGYRLQSQDDDLLEFWEDECNLKKLTSKEKKDLEVKLAAKKFNM